MLLRLDGVDVDQGCVRLAIIIVGAVREGWNLHVVVGLAADSAARSSDRGEVVLLRGCRGAALLGGCRVRRGHQTDPAWSILNHSDRLRGLVS